MNITIGNMYRAKKQLQLWNKPYTPYNSTSGVIESGELAQLVEFKEQVVEDWHKEYRVIYARFLSGFYLGWLVIYEVTFDDCLEEVTETP